MQTTTNINHIVSHLFKQETLDEVSTQQLQDFIKTYPYAGIGHLLLAKKMQTSSQEEETAARAGLYNTNPLWHYLMLNDVEEDIPFEVAPIVPPAAPEASAVVIAETVVIEETVVEAAPAPTEAQIVPAEMSVPEEREPVADVPVPTETETTVAAEAATPQVEEEPVAADLPPAEEITETEEAAPETVVEEAMPAPEVETVAAITEETALPEAETTGETEAPPAEQVIPDAPAFKISLPPLPQQVTEEDDTLAFDPYHTIDYFASQGIRIKKEDLLKDNFGVQLKSFTEWLRSMKRLPQAVVDTETQLDEKTHASIRQGAQLSVEEKEILTETMAEVWAKQGNKVQAIQIYQKLSLLNPGKRHYFAAKIDKLNSK